MLADIMPIVLSQCRLDTGLPVARKLALLGRVGNSQVSPFK